MNGDENDDPQTSTPFLCRPVYVLLMASQSIADDVTIIRQIWREHMKNDVQFVRYRFDLRRYS